MPGSLPQSSLSHSHESFVRAQHYFPGGVNSPVRAFRAVGGEPPVIARGQGSRIFDVDGKSYIDYVGAYGPLILGHAHPAVVEAIRIAAQDGTSFGMPTERETQLAELICRAMPSIDMLRFVSSGTEATMSALRLARAYTGRNLIVKFEGCYHGHSDSLLVKAGSGVATLGLPGSAGVPPAIVSQTLVAAYNEIAAIEDLFDRYPNEIAAVILEPVAANMGVVAPKQDYLAQLRALTLEYGALLVFDEVITGFRVGPNGAQGLWDVMPDITCLGKIIGGGLPVGAYGGRREIMEQVAPLGPMYQAGTLSGNPIAMAAGIATLSALQAPDTYQRLDRLAAKLEDGLRRIARQTGTPAHVNRVGSILTMFCAGDEVFDYATALTSDTEAYARLHAGLLKRGVFLAPSQFEAAFISLAHTEADIDETLEAAESSLRN
jgi:glutamate-1-semialdehyde 2,1-aminomutase